MEDPVEIAEVVTEPADPLNAVAELPEDPSEAVAVLNSALAESRAEAGRYFDDYRRMAAEFDNFRKRAQRDQTDLVARASERVVSSMLPVLDSLDAAMSVEADGDTAEKLLDGIRGTREQLMALLRTEGLEEIEAVGTAFDPELHEAVQVEEGSGELVVTAGLRRGYRFKDRVLRAALVVVGYEGAGEH